MFDPHNPSAPPSPAALDAMMTGRYVISTAEPHVPAPGDPPPPPIDWEALAGRPPTALFSPGAPGFETPAAPPAPPASTPPAPAPAVPVPPLASMVPDAAAVAPSPPLEWTTAAPSTPLPSATPAPSLDAVIGSLTMPYTPPDAR